jgi:tetratricopeptide (TPR) repeat protein
MGATAVLVWEQYHLRAARQALDRYAFDEASHHLDRCLVVYSRSPAVRLLAAQAARRRDAYEEAADHLADCVQLGGMNEDTALERMMLAAQQGDLDGVEDSLRAHTGPGGPAAELVLEALAKGYASRFWRAQALECLNTLLERWPGHAQALLMRARLSEARPGEGVTERDEDALHDYEQAVSVRPTFEARLGLAGALYRVGRPEEAASQYEQLRASQPSSPDVLLGLARCRYNLSETEEAQRLLDELLDQQPTSGGALLERGRLALHAGEWSEAEQWLRRAVALAPRWDCETLRLLYQCLLAAHKPEDARKCLDEIGKREAEFVHLDRLTLRANREPHNLALRFAVAMEMRRLGREHDAVAALWFILEQDPGYGPAHEALADYFEQTGQPGRAARERRAGLSGARAATPDR